MMNLKEEKARSQDCKTIRIPDIQTSKDVLTSSELSCNFGFGLNKSMKAW
ncbi:MAG: hypothetical protein ABSF81_04060 [Bacteroidales bacterium]